MARIVVIGPGAIGGTMAAWLAQGGHDVALCVRTPFDALEVETPDGGKLTARPAMMREPAQARPADWVLVATKAYDAEATARWFPGFGAGARFAILQNGVEHVERFSPYVAGDRIVPVVVECPAERTAPGAIRQRRKAVLAVPAGRNGADFAALFAGTAVECAQSPDWRSVAWWKLCVNAPGALSAILLMPGGILQRDDVADAARIIIRECIAVGRAEGAVLADAVADEVVERYRSAAPDAINSMHADRLAGRRTEIDARNGAIVRLGRRHGIPTPANELCCALMEALAKP